MKILTQDPLQMAKELTKQRVAIVDLDTCGFSCLCPGIRIGTAFPLPIAVPPTSILYPSPIHSSFPFTLSDQMTFQASPAMIKSPVTLMGLPALAPDLRTAP